MKITLCGSTSTYSQMDAIKSNLENLGHEVYRPSDVHVEKSEAIHRHFTKVAEADAVLIINQAKNNIENYIGPNTFLEMGLAFYLKKSIYLLNPVPDVKYKEEVLAMKPIVLDGDFSKMSKESEEVSDG